MGQQARNLNINYLIYNISIKNIVGSIKYDRLKIFFFVITNSRVDISL